MFSPDHLKYWVLACCIGFPVAHFLFRRVRKAKRPSRGEAIERIIIGASAPQALYLVAAPFNPDILKSMAAQPLLLLPTGAVMLLFSVASLFDWND